MRSIVTIFFCVMATFMGFGQVDLESEFNHDGESREYRIHLPPDFDPKEKLPLVLNFHGLGSTSGEQLLYSALTLVSDTANFVLVHPQGLPTDLLGSTQNHWNAGFGTGVDDLGFIDRLIDTMIVNYNVDPTKVYATGMSNGGYMAYFLACRLSNRIAATESGTGSMTSILQRDCEPDRAVPIMQIHGTDDPTVAYLGTPTIPDMVEYWAVKNNCQPTPIVESLPDLDPNDGTTTEKHTYRMCSDDSEIWFYIVDKGGHTWPGAFPIAALGKTSGDFNASEHIWWFFRKYELDFVASSENAKDVVDFLVYPNPVYDVLRISHSFQDPIIRNISGQNMNFSRRGNSIRVDHFPAGIYFINVDGVQRKFIKQ